MALQPDLYAAFSRALSSAGMDSADHSAISQAMADDITSAITSCIRSAVTTTSYTGVTLVPPGVGAVAVGTGSLDPTPGSVAFRSGLYALLMNISGGSTFALNFATLINALFISSIVTDSYVGSTIAPTVPPAPVPLSGSGVGTVLPLALPALQAALITPPTYVPPSAEVGNNFVATTWATAIITFFSANALTMSGGVTNPGLVGAGVAVGFL